MKHFESRHQSPLCMETEIFPGALWGECWIVPVRQVMINLTVVFRMSGPMLCDARLSGGQLKVFWEVSLAASPRILSKLSNSETRPDSMSSLWITLAERLLLTSRTKGMPAQELCVCHRRSFRSSTQSELPRSNYETLRDGELLLKGNISLFLTNGTSLAAVSDVCQPELAPAVSFDIACRSTRVKCDFPTSGVKPSILPTEDGDR